MASKQFNPKFEINIDLLPLENIRKKLGAKLVEFDSGVIIKPRPPIEIHKEFKTWTELKEHFSIKQKGKPLIDKEGNINFLYIKDHTNLHKYNRNLNHFKSIDNPGDCKKVHITWCQTLSDMEKEDRFDRYVATNRTDGIFLIDFLNDDNDIEEKKVKLNVCQNCLKAMALEKSLYDNFDYDWFVSNYSNQNIKKPKYTPENIPSSTYTNDFNKISENYRNSVSWICEECGLDCSSNKHLLDTHHKNGIKGDNNKSNLKALCKLCHKEIGYHKHYYISNADRNLILSLRKKQDILTKQPYLL